MKKFKHKAKLKEAYSEYSYTHYLDSTINILLYLLHQEYNHLYSHLCPSIHFTYFLFETDSWILI